ncbi:TPA: PmbA [Klebsiella pneumoniae]|nr:PmbA [Klebsiella pneumoniae]
MRNKQHSITSSSFAHSQQQLAELAESVIDMALKAGASDAQVHFSESVGFTIEMRQGCVRSRTRHARSGMTLTVYRGHHEGTISTTDFSPRRLQEAVNAACQISNYTGADPDNGLADEADFCHEMLELDLWHPWSLDETAAMNLTRRVEEGIASVSDEVLSDGAWIYSGQDSWYLMNNRGLALGAQQSLHDISAKALATRGDEGVIDFWGAQSCHPQTLPAPEEIGRQAGNGALKALDIAELPGTRRCPVMFSPASAISLLEHLVQALSGRVLYQGNSFLGERLGQKIFNNTISVVEDPFLPRGLASRSFDCDGVSGSRRNIIDCGVLTGYFLSLYAARRLGMKPTGNGWGPGNVRLISDRTCNDDDFKAILKKLGTGLLVTNFGSGGPRLINGDYSRSVRGFWVVDGQVLHAIDGMTIAGNLADIYQNIVAVGNDTLTRGAFTCGSVLIEHMQLSGR